MIIEMITGIKLILQFIGFMTCLYWYAELVRYIAKKCNITPFITVPFILATGVILAQCYVTFILKG